MRMAAPVGRAQVNVADSVRVASTVSVARNVKVAPGVEGVRLTALVDSIRP